MQQPIGIPLQDGELIWIPTAFEIAESMQIHQLLLKEIEWEQRKIRMFGKWINQPRLTAWYADPGMTYTYSGLEWQPKPWTTLLLHLKASVESYAQHAFNSVLLNRYRDGQDSMGWHSDDEKELGNDPVIASLSFGAERSFHLRHRFDKTVEKVKLTLTSGSLLIMKGSTQSFWHHQLPKSKRESKERVNLTFRFIHNLKA